MTMNQKTREAVQTIDQCRDGRELFRIEKQRPGEKRSIVGVSCLKDEIGVVKVSVDD